MKMILENTPFGVMTYEETLLTGRKTLTVNGVTLNSVNKNDFVYRVGEEVIVFHWVSDRKRGLLLTYAGGEILLLRRGKLYEQALCWLGFLFIVVWGASPALCRLLPVLGGLLGGAVGGAFAGLGSYLSRRARTPLMRLLIPLGTSLTAIALCALMGFVLVN